MQVGSLLTQGKYAEHVFSFFVTPSYMFMQLDFYLFIYTQYMRVSIKKDSSMTVDVGDYFSVHQQLWVFSVRGIEGEVILKNN